MTGLLAKRDVYVNSAHIVFNRSGAIFS